VRAECPQTPRLRRHKRQSVTWGGVRDPNRSKSLCGPVPRFCAHGARVGTGVRCMRARLTRAAAATRRSGARECLVPLCALGGAVGRARHSACTVATRGRRACGATVLARVRSSRGGAQGRRAPNGVSSCTMPRGRQLVGGVPALERALQHARHEGGDARTRAYLRARRGTGVIRALSSAPFGARGSSEAAAAGIARANGVAVLAGGAAPSRRSAFA
jgi:hypothetical protein